MRAALFVLLAACTPQIASGSYLCGAQESCPVDQACDGITDTCVITSSAKPFACETGTEIPGDDTSATAQPIPQLACVSPPYQVHECLPMGDMADWFKFSVPSTCLTVEVQARILSPVAYEGISMELWDLGANSPIGTDVPCADSIDDPAHVERCIKLTIVPGGNYGLLVKPNGQGTCGGSCTYNRYDLSVQLETPG